jgi:hypothetical protein
VRRKARGFVPAAGALPANITSPSHSPPATGAIFRGRPSAPPSSAGGAIRRELPAICRPRDRHALHISQFTLAVASWDGAIHVWDWQAKRETARLPSAARDVDALFFDTDSHLHVIANGRHWEWDMVRRVPRIRIECGLPVRMVRISGQNVWLGCGDGIRHVDTGPEQWHVSSAIMPRGIGWIVADGATALAGGEKAAFRVRDQPQGSKYRLCRDL